MTHSFSGGDIVDYLNYKRIGTIAAALIFLTSIAMTAFAQKVSVEANTNRPGLDYKNFELTDAQPEICQDACVADPNCKAYTYVRPGVQGPKAYCWLKSGVPEASASDCCVSGAKTAAASMIISVPARPEVTTKDEGAVTGPALNAKGDCGLTLPCGGTVSIASPAFSIVNLRGAGVLVQGGGAGLFGSAIRAKNTNETGIGIWSNTASSDANLVITNTGSGDLMRGFSGGGGGDLVFRVLNDGATKVRSLEANTSTDAGVRGINTGSGAGVVGVSFNAGGVGGSFSNTKGGTALEVKGTASMSDVEASVLKITGGSDLAERFEVSDEAKPGMVVAIDPDHPGMLCIAKGAYNRRVAGILSGANNLGAGMVLADLPGAKNSMPMALSGRVWVYADATRKAIEPGDLLTTADVPGYAMAVTNHARAQGAIIGKAMTGLNSGKGLIVVLVALQ